MSETATPKVGPTDQVASLDVGEAVFFNRPESTKKLVELPGNVTASRDTLRNSVASAIRNAKARPGNEDTQFTQEVCHLITPSGRVYAVSIVTRTA